MIYCLNLNSPLKLKISLRHNTVILAIPFMILITFKSLLFQGVKQALKKKKKKKKKKKNPSETMEGRISYLCTIQSTNIQLIYLS